MEMWFLLLGVSPKLKPAQLRTRAPRTVNPPGWWPHHGRIAPGPPPPHRRGPAGRPLPTTRCDMRIRTTSARQLLTNTGYKHYTVGLGYVIEALLLVLRGYGYDLHRCSDRAVLNRCSWFLLYAKRSTCVVTFMILVAVLYE